MKNLIYLLSILVLVSACNPGGKREKDGFSAIDSTHLEAKNLYSIHCAGCHGADMGGGNAAALIKEDWKYGRTKGLMFRNVKFGIPGTEMATFEAVLSDDNIGKLVSYIRESQGTPPERKVDLPDIIQTADYKITIEKVVNGGIEVPWAIEFVDNEHALISERTGKLRWLVNGKINKEPVHGTPAVYLGTSTGGYMDIALDPNYTRNGWVYLSYSYSRANYNDSQEPATTRVIRGKIKENQWTEEQVLFEAPDSLWVVDGNRWGCRLLFDNEGHLIFTIGDMGRDMDSQDPGVVSGKTFRINSDGSIPRDNPYRNTEGALAAIYSLGNRNVQGLSIDPATGKIWASEHGPMGGDELNILKKGANYGWPVITYGRDYSGATVSEKTHQEGMEQPLWQWTPSIGVCPIEFVNNSVFEKWKGNLLVGSLAFEDLTRYVIEGDSIVGSELIWRGLGRIRDVKTAPDGSIYVVLNSPDWIVRLGVSK
ncbi:MAG: PQQ-dependent sugar dehydrogenase [Cyclobacteriaceae bacterium]|nr:PQQ-dependent sugar dehydrogenase [Cyclobacteriaceae bacterium]